MTVFVWHIYLLKITPNITVRTTSITDYPNVNVSTLKKIRAFLVKGKNLPGSNQL